MRFRDIQNNQGRGKSYQPKPKAEVGCVYFFFAASKTWFCLLKNLPFCPVLAWLSFDSMYFKFKAI